MCRVVQFAAQPLHPDFERFAGSRRFLIAKIRVRRLRCRNSNCPVRFFTLRRLKRSARPAKSGARIIGLDEWAKRKGTVYGTIIVVLERRRVIDLLDQHSTEAVGKWLSEHPGIHTICRDRNGCYARAVRSEVPNAKQVADCFHLVQNLRQTIERELSLCRVHLRIPARWQRTSRDAANDKFFASERAGPGLRKNALTSTSVSHSMGGGSPKARK